ncbi:exported hypothetical protein [Nitrosotalea sinensis]|uniref:Uncharacterized protein n=2 Tax=Nitrosotalea sinensis TaxID=1499975 RepID=A0A2H1EHA3_9ARCH|nr:exported hypothetical protein [Candidatus Nitrosotalea sinensis]
MIFKYTVLENDYMKITSILLLALTLSLVLPIGFSGVYAENEGNDNQTKSPDENQTRSGENDTGMATMPNLNGTNVGQEISDFVHNATTIFQQQKVENIQAIKDCHEQMKTAAPENRTQIIDQCHATLKTIQEKYQDLRTQFNNLFKQFGKNLMTLKHDAEGSKISDDDRNNAIKGINDDAAKHKIHDLNMTGLAKGLKEHGKMGVGEERHMSNATDESEMHGKHG